MKDSFIFYTEYAEVLDTLTAEQAGYLLRALVSYAKDESVQITDAVVKAVFMTIKPRMDRDRRKWELEVEKRREAGRKGGQAKAKSASNDKQNVAQPSNAKQRLTTLADNDAVTVTDNVSNNTNSAISRAEVERIFDHVWKEYPEKKGKARVSYADKRKLAEIGEEKILEAIRRYKAEIEALSWKQYQNGSTFFHSGYVDYLDGNYTPTVVKGKTVRPPERTYDMDDLEIRLLATN